MFFLNFFNKKGCKKKVDIKKEKRFLEKCIECIPVNVNYDCPTKNYIVEQYINLVYTTVKKKMIYFKKVINEEECELLCIDTFLYIFDKDCENIQQFDYSKGKKSLSSWIYTATCWTVYNYYRKKGFDHSRWGENQEEFDESFHKDNRDNEKDNLDKIYIEKAIEKLSPEKKLIIILFYFDGCTSKEIAKLAGKSQKGIDDYLFKDFPKLIGKESTYFDQLRHKAKNDLKKILLVEKK